MLQFFYIRYRNQFSKASIFLLALQTALTAFSQDLKQDLERMNAFYSQPGYMTIDIKAKVFQNGSTEGIYVQSGKIRKKDAKFFYDLNGTRMLLGRDYMMMVHSQEKNIIYSRITEKQYADFRKNFVSQQLDSVLASYDSTRFIGKSNGLNHYRIYSSGQSIIQTEIFLNEANGGLAKIIYRYNPKIWGQNYKVEITFNTTTEPFQDELISESNYIRREGDKLTLTSAYHNFNLIQTNHED